MQRHRRTRGDDAGASAVEYGLLVAAIAAVIVLAVFAMGQATKVGFDETCKEFDQNSSPAVQQATTCP